MRAHRPTFLALLAAGGLGFAPAARGEDVKVDSDTFGGIEAGSIGPAALGGRITALAAIPGDRLTIWVGAAGGGLWKSVDGDLAFKPVFDKHNQSIGAVTVDPKNPKTVDRILDHLRRRDRIPRPPPLSAQPLATPA